MHVKYNRTTLAAEVTARSGLPPEDVSQIVNMAVEVMAEALSAGGEVQLSTLGTLTAFDRPARQAFLPKAGEYGDIGERRRYKFRAGPTLLARGAASLRVQREAANRR